MPPRLAFSLGTKLRCSRSQGRYINRALPPALEALSDFSLTKHHHSSSRPPLRCQRTFGCALSNFTGVFFTRWSMGMMAPELCCGKSTFQSSLVAEFSLQPPFPPGTQPVWSGGRPFRYGLEPRLPLLLLTHLLKSHTPACCPQGFKPFSRSPTDFKVMPTPHPHKADKMYRTNTTRPLLQFQLNTSRTTAGNLMLYNISRVSESPTAWPTLPLFRTHLANPIHLSRT